MVRKTKTQLDENGKLIGPDKKTKDLQDIVKGRCVDVNPAGNLIAAGFKDGTVRLYDTETLSQKFICKHAKEWISDLRFSPDGSRLAVGSHDNVLYMYVMCVENSTGTFTQFDSNIRLN